MQQNELMAALDMFSNLENLKADLEKELQSKTYISEALDFAQLEKNKESSDIFIHELASCLDDIHPEYKKLRLSFEKEHGKTKRDLNQVADLIGDAYNLLKENAGMFSMIILLLNNYGKLEKIKKNPKLKPLLDALLGDKTKK